MHVKGQTIQEKIYFGGDTSGKDISRALVHAIITRNIEKMCRWLQLEREKTWNAETMYINVNSQTG